MRDWRDVATALLGSWPATVSSWRAETLAAYVGQLEARGMTPDDAYTAILAWDGGDQIVPPSAPQVAAIARRDPNRPTADEAIAQIYGPGGVLGFKRRGVTISPWVTAFVERYGIDRLRMLEVDGDHGHLIRNDLRQSWEQFLEATDGREVAALTGGRRGQLGRFDPLAALSAPRGSDLELVKAADR